MKYDEQNAYLLSQGDVDQIYRLIEHLGGTLQALLTVRCHNFATKPQANTPHERYYAECATSIKTDFDL